MILCRLYVECGLRWSSYNKQGLSWKKVFSLGQHVFINVYIVYHWGLMVPSQVFILPVVCTVMHTNACCSLAWWIIFSSILFNFLYLYPFSVGLEPFFCTSWYFLHLPSLTGILHLQYLTSQVLISWWLL